jgi:Flp pilus assembly protein TadB
MRPGARHQKGRFLMRTQPSAFIVLAVAIVVAACVLALSPMLWTDHYWGDKVGKFTVPSSCSLQTMGYQNSFVVVHCPVWVQVVG